MNKNGMPRPKSAGEKKANFSLSLTPTEAKALKSRALNLGFPNPSNYLLALHEAEQRLQLIVKSNFNGQRWFFAPDQSDPVPEDITLSQALEARREDFEVKLQTKTAHLSKATIGKEVLEGMANKLKNHPVRSPAAERSTH